MPQSNDRVEGSHVGYPREPGTPRDKVQREINRVLGEGTLDTEAGDIERFSTRTDVREVEGLVVVRRDHKYQPWVVWRWITQFANGTQVPGPTGARLWSGGYYDDREQAMRDFNERRYT